MGKRKLRFDRRKNAERKKFSSFLVKINRSVYESATVSTSLQLQNRLIICSKIPPDWMIFSKENILSLCKVFYNSLSQTTYSLTLTINDQCFWTVKLDNIEISKHHCESLQMFDERVLSVEAATKVIESLCNTKICCGNNDEKFMVSCNRRNGEFKDHTGMYSLKIASTCKFFKSIVHRFKNCCLL